MRLPKLKIPAKWLIVAVAVAVVVVVLAVLARRASSSSVAIKVDGGIGLTATQVESIRQIGQWELLSVSAEEMIDTVRYGFFGDDGLTRIYYGTMRIGVDLKEAGEQWIRVVGGDSLAITLPPVKLLDRDFIDETLTQSFYESGKWSHADREAMRQRAYAAMMRRGLTDSNFKAARSNGVEQFRKMFRALGFDKVGVVYEE